MSLIYWNEEKHGEKSFFFSSIPFLLTDTIGSARHQATLPMSILANTAHVVYSEVLGLAELSGNSVLYGHLLICMSTLVMRLVSSLVALFSHISFYFYMSALLVRLSFHVLCFHQTANKQNVYEC